MHSSFDTASKTVTFILAGGKGKRLSPLTGRRAKPLVPFGGFLRLIDFTLSNCINSGLNRVYLLTQYEANSIHEYINVPAENTEFSCVPSRVSRLYRGTADAVAQNLGLLDLERPDHVLILSADHIYKMDYRKLLRFHTSHGGAVTIAASESPRQLAKELGVLETDASGRITGFEEKPQRLRSVPGDSSNVLTSMGVYVFRPSILRQALVRDALSLSTHDFGQDILPSLVSSHAVYACKSSIWSDAGSAYWRDVGSIDSYHMAHMELMQTNPPFDPYGDSDWPVYRRGVASFEHVRPIQRTANSIVCSNSTAFQGGISESVISPDVEVDPSAKLRDSIVMRGARIGRDARIRRTIVEEGIHIPAGMKIGFNLNLDRERFVVTDGGVVVVHSENRRRLDLDSERLLLCERIVA